ncbi:MAG: carboxypeptidase regulatory-like domain-containing protein, partial [Lentisphaeria bacterium]|nr:carboxypeptidase regulatory-like domain-containing protein [Lentisphaeria bacterium]
MRAGDEKLRKRRAVILAVLVVCSAAIVAFVVLSAVRHEGPSAGLPEGPADSEPVRLRGSSPLQSSTRLRVAVRHDLTHAPVPGAVCMVRDSGGQVVDRARTNAAGNAELQVLGRVTEEALTLTVQCEGFLGRTMDAKCAGGETIELTAAGGVAGRVTDPEGVGLETVDIWVSGSAASLHLKTGPGGSYEQRSLVPGTELVMVCRRTGFHDARRTVTVKSGRTTVDVQLNRRQTALLDLQFP